MLLSSADRKASCWVEKSNQTVCSVGSQITPSSKTKIPTLVEFLTAENTLIYMEPLETLEQDWISITQKGVR
jgi:hypothetical protein